MDLFQGKLIKVSTDEGGTRVGGAGSGTVRV
jgi:hypothetical protein